jgi:hypothetical protein
VTKNDEWTPGTQSICDQTQSFTTAKSIAWFYRKSHTTLN